MRNAIDSINALLITVLLTAWLVRVVLDLSGDIQTPSQKVSTNCRFDPEAYEAPFIPKTGTNLNPRLNEIKKQTP